jgi:uncharacterized membrane protein
MRALSGEREEGASMDLVTTAYGWEFLLRWFHFMAGVAWIGMLWYFNLVQTPFFATELGGSVKGAMTRGLVPVAMWWFRWGAMFTFLTGWLLILSYIGHGGMGLGDPLITRILTGGLLGTLMWFNVWFVIWPAQRDYVIKSAEQVAGGGKPVDGTPEKAALAGRTSRTNTLFSIPMLFFMGSARHLDFLHTGENDAIYWVVFALLVLLLEFNAVGPAAPGRQKYLTTVSGVVHVGLVLTALLYVAGVVLNT